MTKPRSSGLTLITLAILLGLWRIAPGATWIAAFAALVLLLVAFWSAGG